MKDQFSGIEAMVNKSKIGVPYSWWAGDTASKFLISLRDDKKIIGMKCSQCSKVYIPPRKVCPTCFIDNTEWVEVSDEGTVISFTVARRQLASIPKKVPVIYAIIMLDGADTGVLHFIDNIQPDAVKIGMRVKAVFADERKGRIRDIAYFKPL